MEPTSASASPPNGTHDREDALPPYEIFDSQDTTPFSAPSSQSSFHSPLPPLNSEQEHGVIYPSSGSYFPPRAQSTPTFGSEATGRALVNASGSSSSQERALHLQSQTDKVIAYLIPFPRPRVPNLAYVDIPEQFLMYMLPQLQVPPPDSSEQAGKADKTRQKALKEITKTASKAKSADVAFLSRFPDPLNFKTKQDRNDNCALQGSDEVRFGELVVVYPPTSRSNEKEIKTLFMNCLLEWGEALAGSAAKMSKILSRRLTHNCICGHHEHERLDLSVKSSVELEILSRYLAKHCWEQDQRLFPHPGLMTPTEQDVLDALGWEPSEAGIVVKGAKDWESLEMQGDVKTWMKKGAKKWAATCKKLDKQNNGR